MFHNNEDIPSLQVISGKNGNALSDSNVFQTLLIFAEAYFEIGYSVIPLLGDRDPSRPKVPAVPWAAFQQQRANLTDHQYWFTQSQFAGLGIVTGRVSQLVALDFDSEAIFNTFKAQHPDLLETHTVLSAGRRLPHLYFKLPPHLHLPSQKGQGVDLLSDGRYVVAPPTTINGQPYKISRGAMPKTLTERDIRRLQSFMAAHKSTTPTSHNNKVPSSHLATKWRGDGGEDASAIVPPSPTDLRTLYHHLAATRGRNEALFHASLFARDQRLSLQQTESILVPLHSQQPTSGHHIRENIQQRQREALKTIRSAFSRPPRAPSLVNRSVTESGLVFNSVRERLLQQKMTYVLRTFEALLQSGMRPGQRFTAAQVIKRLKGVVGRDSILKALKAGQGDLLFFRPSPPVSPPNTPNGIAHSHTVKGSKKCFLIGSKNQEKIGRGRPEVIYQMPDNRTFCKLLGVKVTNSDAIASTDLHSARQTRLALHRELIKRRAGHYSKRWLAARLGVSRRTIFTYNHLLPIHSRAMFLETPIDWKTIQRLPLDEPLKGAYLQTIRGRKYPARRQIASTLLGKGEILCLKQQTVNFYWYGDAEPSPLEWLKVADQQIQKQEMVEAFLSRQPTIASAASPPRTPPVSRPSQKQKSPVGDYKKPLPDAAREALALRLYEALNQLAGVEFKKLSRATARQLISAYTETLLWDTLQRVKQRATAGNIRNPVGFFLILLRGQPSTR